MFSFIRKIYRRLVILILLFKEKCFEFIKSSAPDDQNKWLEECSPFRTNFELLNYIRSPFSWCSLVEPLATRCEPRKYGNKFLKIDDTPENCMEIPNENHRPKVLVCHDMAGNYRGDRFIHGSSKFDDYRFYHWSGIDFFCYFSHNYITIPPLSWINAGHRNGVPVLGTIIIEFAKAKPILDELLSSKHHMNQYIEALVVVTKNFGFDGWLLNIECTVDGHQVPLLKQFVRQISTRIHEEIPNGVVFWYDSVIETGKLLWQNEVNKENIDMYKGSDGILLNYGWTAAHLQRTVDILQNDPNELAKVFVGIDVFGRGQLAGFYTYETLHLITEHNLSIGIFAPGWTFERMPDALPMLARGSDRTNQRFLERNTRFWALLWKDLYSRGPNTLPFYTSFCLGSGKKKYRDGLQIAHNPWFNLTEQQYQPSVPSVFEYQFEEAYHGGSCIKFTNKVNNIRLFTTDFSCENNLIASYVFKRTDPEIKVQLVLNVQNDIGDSSMLIYCDSDERDEPNIAVEPGKRFLNPLKANVLKYTIVGLSNRHEKIFPSSNRPILGWKTKYFYLNFDEIAKLGRVIDIGISINKHHWNGESDCVLLGALQIHSGIDDGGHITRNMDVISFDKNDSGEFME